LWLLKTLLLLEVLTMRGLVRYVVFFVMKLKTRAGGDRWNHGPDEAWMTQVSRNLNDARDGFLRGVQYLILTETRCTPAPFGACCGTVA
jgi:hypothetical protein